MDDGGYITQREHTMTSLPRVFSVGDVSDKRYRQAVTAAGDGCRAAIDSERWLEEQGEAEHAEDPAVWTAEKDREGSAPRPERLGEIREAGVGLSLTWQGDP